MVQHDRGARWTSILAIAPNGAELRDRKARRAHVAVAIEIADAEAIQRVEAHHIRIEALDHITEPLTNARLIELHEAILRAFDGVNEQTFRHARPIVFAEPLAQPTQIILQTA